MSVTYTPNFNLGKQTDHSDKFDMSVITDNMDKIDGALEQNKTQIAACRNDISDLQTSQSEQADKVAALETVVAEKVDKVEGMGLSTNDFTDADKNKLDGLESYGYTYSGASAQRKNYYYCIAESTVVGTSNFESVQAVLSLRSFAVLNANSAKFGIIYIQGRYDQNGDGTNDNTFTVINVNWIIASNISTDRFVVVYNDAEKKIRLYYHSSTTYDGFAVQKIFADTISATTGVLNPTTLMIDTVGIETLPDGWTVASVE